MRHRRVLSGVAIAAFVALVLVSGADSAIVNGGFEPDFTGWTLASGADAQTLTSLGPNIVPTEGTHFAELTTLGTTNTTTLGGTTGTIVTQSIAATAGDTVKADYRFLTNEDGTNPSFNDFARGELLDGGTVMATLFSIDAGSAGLIDCTMQAICAGSGFTRGTGWATGSATVAASGTYTLRFFVTNKGDSLTTSALLVDHVLQQGAPTAIVGRALAATRTHRGVVVRWKVEPEADVLGFDVCRGRGSLRVRLNHALIPARFGRTRSARAYSFLDPGGRVGTRYWVRIDRLDGGHRWLGPVPAGPRPRAGRPEGG